MTTPQERRDATKRAEDILTAKRPDPMSETQRIMDIICDRLAEGQSLRHICEDEAMPATGTVKRWLRDSPPFQAQYARARAEQAEHYADVIVEIADTEKDAAIAKVRIDARKWVAAKLLPKKYGDKVALVGGTPGEDEPLRVVTDLDRAKAVASLVAKAKAGK